MVQHIGVHKKEVEKYGRPVDPSTGQLYHLPGLDIPLSSGRRRPRKKRNVSPRRSSSSLSSGHLDHHSMSGDFPAPGDLSTSGSQQDLRDDSSYTSERTLNHPYESHPNFPEPTSPLASSVHLSKQRNARSAPFLRHRVRSRSKSMQPTDTHHSRYPSDYTIASMSQSSHSNSSKSIVSTNQNQMLHYPLPPNNTVAGSAPTISAGTPSFGSGTLYAGRTSHSNSLNDPTASYSLTPLHTLWPSVHFGLQAQAGPDMQAIKASKYPSVEDTSGKRV